MKKSTFFSILVIFLLIPLTLYLGTRVKGRWYYLISTMIIIELMLPFFFRFEARRPQARELVILTVMAALAAVSRVAFSFSPFLKTITGIIMITGIAFGPEAGFLCGAISGFASNFIFGQGPWTPWQMFAYGIGGMLAGLFALCGILKKSPRAWRDGGWRDILGLTVFGFLCILLVVGPLLDTSTFFMAGFSASSPLAVYLAGVPVNCVHGSAVALTMLLFGKPLLDRLRRIQIKYGMMEP